MQNEYRVGLFKAMVYKRYTVNEKAVLMHIINELPEDEKEPTAKTFADIVEHSDTFAEAFGAVERTKII